MTAFTAFKFMNSHSNHMPHANMKPQIKQKKEPVLTLLFTVPQDLKSSKQEAELKNFKMFHSSTV